MAWCHSVAKEIDVGGEKESEYIFPETAYVVKVLHSGAADTHRNPPQKAPNAFQEGRSLLEKPVVETNQLSCPKACFKGKILSAKAGVYFRICLHGDLLCHGNNFDMDYDNLYSCVTCPKDGKRNVS